jgi:hypothetical protein
LLKRLSNAGEFPLKRYFFVREEYILEVGGKNKDTSQIKGIENAYLAVDIIEFQGLKKIPILLFNFLY